MEDLAGLCLRNLDADPPYGYKADDAGHPEATAVCALAFRDQGQVQKMHKSLQWLCAQQADDGSVGACPLEVAARWPTGLAVLAWSATAGCPPGDSRPEYAQAAENGVGWILSHRGETMARSESVGHDTELAGWTWVQGTHSWVVPTAINLLALKATGRDSHPRAREAVHLLLDRQLRDGGCNFGNTSVLGSEQRPQLEPTGLAMAALAGEVDHSGGIGRSLDYLERSLSERTSAQSLSYGLIGLAAHGRNPPDAARWLSACLERTLRRGGRPLHLALLCLASSSRRLYGY